MANTILDIFDYSVNRIKTVANNNLYSIDINIKNPEYSTKKLDETLYEPNRMSNNGFFVLFYHIFEKDDELYDAELYNMLEIGCYIDLEHKNVILVNTRELSDTGKHIKFYKEFQCPMMETLNIERVFICTGMYFTDSWYQYYSYNEHPENLDFYFMFSQNLTIMQNLTAQYDNLKNLRISYDIGDFNFNIDYQAVPSFIKQYIQGWVNRITTCIDVDLDQKVKFLEEINNISQNIDKDIIN